MAIVMEANYSKKLGLPGYSSHQYSVTVRAELSDLNQIPVESARLYSMLQGCVDKEIQATGFLPSNSQTIPIRNNGHNGNGTNGNGHTNDDQWRCSDKQKGLILKIVEDNRLDKKAVDQLAQERFGKGVRQLNKLEASGLIEELLEQYGGQEANHGRYQKTGAR